VVAAALIALHLTQRNVQLIRACSGFEWARRWYEPLPFCLLTAATMATVIGAVSTYACVSNLRTRFARIHQLVEAHFDVHRGYPLDDDVLSPNEKALLGGGDEDHLEFLNIQKLPTFVGLYVGNFVAAFLVYHYEN
jgi:hypothetical protein